MSSKLTRKAPLEPSKQHSINTIKRGLDGNLWIISKKTASTKIWKKLSQKKINNKKYIIAPNLTKDELYKAKQDAINIKKIPTSLIKYTAFVLSEASSKLLLNAIKPYLNKRKDWQHFKKHHMTICISDLASFLKAHPKEKTQFKQFNSKNNIIQYKLKISKIGFTNLNLAVKIDNYYIPDRLNEENIKEKVTPHITVALNRKKGAIPLLSKFITKWLPLKTPLIVKGTIQEVEKKYN